MERFASFADRVKDTLKVSGIQVSPVEIEGVLLAEPRGLITDATVAGVSGGRISDEKVPRAWVVLSSAGRMLGADVTIRELKAWHEVNLSKYKWLRGGIEVVKEVSPKSLSLLSSLSRYMLSDLISKIPKSPTGKVLRRVLQDKHEQELEKNMKGKL